MVYFFIIFIYICTTNKLNIQGYATMSMTVQIRIPTKKSQYVSAFINRGHKVDELIPRGYSINIYSHT